MRNAITIRALRVAGYDPGQEVQVSVDLEGTPFNPFWRRRLRDAKKDGCCEIVPIQTVEEPQVETPRDEERNP